MEGGIFSDEMVDDPDDMERVIVAGAEEGQGGRDSENEEVKNEDENAKEKVKTKRKLGPRPIINVQRLLGPRGIGTMESFFSDLKFKFKGKHHEKADLELVMGRLEHWTHRLCPRMQFDEALKKIKKLGAKKEVSNYVKRIRLGLIDHVESESVLENEPHNSDPDVDPFDQLIASTDVSEQPTSKEMTEEQRERMLQNRLIAEERRNARIKRAQELKAEFLANQKLSQRENSQTAESDSEAKTQENEIQRNNLQDTHMEIDENLTPGIVSELDNNKVNEENVGEIQTDRNNQSNFVEKDKENISNLKQSDTIGQNTPMEGVENCLGILTEKNKA